MKTTITEKANAVKPLPARMEDEVKHTPGPWTKHRKARGHRWIIRGGPMVPSAIVPPAICEIVHAHGFEQESANARLIAAVPALLEALKALMETEDEIRDSTCQVSQQARAAIAQAEGGRQ